MKIILKFAVIFFVMLVCVSCEEKKKYQLVEIWDGQNFNLTHMEYPVSIVWFKETATDLWIPHKGFSQAKEINEIIQRVQRPDVNEPVSNLRTHNKMSLFYYNGGFAVSRILVFYFDVNDGLFIGPGGRSKELGKFLDAKEESGLSRYAFAVPPYNESQIDNFERMSKYVQEKQRRYEEEKHGQDANKINK